MNYTIHQLQIFLKVTETKSITKAAEQLFMTQPAVSIQLKNLQNQFPIPLTEVVGRQLYVTDFGHEIAIIAGRVINELGQINYKTDAYEGVMVGKLSVSVASTGKYVMPYFLTGFIAQHKGIDLVLDVTNKSMVVNSLKNNEIEFALVSVLPTSLEVEEEILIENKLFLISNQDKADKKKQLIYREEGSATRSSMETFFRKKDGNNRKSMELTSNEAVKQAVIAGLGSSIMPLIGLKNELIEGQLYILPTKGLPIQSQWRLIWLKGKKLTPVGQAFLAYIRAEKEQIKAAHFQWYQNY
ncbi:MAG: DNA-binding transcriptional LysR family regulator [Marivirga sp.]|jgi:DNA-binding transcriptional LysR family regulator